MIKLRQTFSLFITICVLISAFPIDISASSTDDSQFVSVIVELEEGASRQKFTSSVKKLLPDSEIRFSYGYIINGISLTLRVSDLEELAALDGVKKVYADTEYSACAAEDTQYTLVFADNVSRNYDPDFGLNRVIAVIDSGFLTNHEQFTLPNGGIGRLKYHDIQDLNGFTNAYKLFEKKRSFTKSVYKSEKVPFAFDYADIDTDVLSKNDHGTAMAAIAAGNLPEGSAAVGGVAPAAQLMLLKVFENDGLTAKTSAVIAALEDALCYGADVISISLGTPGGFSQYGLLDIPLEDMINTVLDAGVPVVCSAGNNSSLGKGSVYDDYFGYSDPLAALPDSGTVHTPSTIPDVFSVGSANTYSGRYPALYLAEDNRYIPYSDSNAGVFDTGYRYGFAHTFDSQTLEYTVVPGIGTPEDFSQVDVKGKIALIERGEITFAEKNNNAAAAGAVAAIIYDNTDVPDSLLTKMQLDESPAYAVFISRRDGLALVAAKDKRVSIDKKVIYVGKSGAEATISDYSSSGPTPTLDIKPEITAEGENMTVASANGGYTTMSGTSNAAAYTAGIIAGVIDKVSDLEGRDKVRAVKSLLMSVSEPLAQTIADSKKSYFSVNLQGAGMIDSKLAKSAEVIIEGENGAKIELGNRLEDKFSTSLTIRNLSEQELSFKISSLIGTEEVEEVPYSSITDEKDPFYKLTDSYIYEYLGHKREDSVYFTTGKIKPFENASVKLGKSETNMDSPLFTGASIRVGAGQTLGITLDFDLSELDKAELLEIYENGFFVEGFIMLDGETDYSIPLLGFVGDFYSIDPFGETLYDAEGAVFGGSYIFSHVDTPELNSEIFLGTNNIEHRGESIVKLKSSLSFISPYVKGGDGIIYLSLSLLRNLTRLDTEIIAPDGSVVTASGRNQVFSKAFPERNFGTAAKHRFILWDLRHEENDKFIYDDGLYLCKISGTDASGRIFKEEISFEIDSVKPTLKFLGITESNGRRELEIKVSDNNYVQHVAIKDSLGEMPDVDNSPFEADNLVGHTRGTETSLTIDVTGLDGDYLYVTVYDIAFNSAMARIELNN